jgi:adenylate cyclase
MPKKDTQGLVTLVFSDIEHSTQLVQQLREDYPRILEKYRNCIRYCLEQYNGREIDTSGDGFFMTFDCADDAVSAVSEIQMKFHNETWATANHLKVRFGVHSGEAIATKTGYVGIEVHAASRICDAAYGGQVIISGATRNNLNKDFEGDKKLSFLGRYVMKDIGYPLHLYQLNIPDADDYFPEPRIKPDEKKIAVLPFTTMNDSTDFEHVGEGMAEELIVALSKVKGLRVASRSMAFATQHQQLGPRDIGEKLKVHYVLEGRVKPINGHIHLSVELIDTKTGFNIWAEQFYDSRSRLVRLQDSIVMKISRLLDCPMISGQLDSVKVRHTHVAEAYDYYLRGRRFYQQFSTRGSELAIKMFNRAIDADENYSLAYAGLADCYSYLYQHRTRTKKIILKADRASKRAIKLAPGLAEANVSRGIVISLLGHMDKAEPYFEKAIEVDPTLFLGWFHYGRVCFASGNVEKAARLFQQANRVEPDDFQSILLSAQIYDDIGSHDFAQLMAKRGAEIAYKCLKVNPGDTRAMYMAANALAFINEKEESLKLLHTALVLEPEDSMLLYNAGCVFSLLNMKNEALSCVERSYEAGLTLRGWYENDSNLDNIRNEERFIKLMEKLKLG